METSKEDYPEGPSPSARGARGARRGARGTSGAYACGPSRGRGRGLGPRDASREGSLSQPPAELPGMDR